MNRANIATALIVIVTAAYFVVSLESAWSQTPPSDPGSWNSAGQSLSGSVTSRVRDWSRIVQSVATVLAIGLGGVFAWRNSQIFRAKAPHVSIEHEVSHRFVGTKYVHIALTTILHNSSRVNIEFLDGFSSIQQLSPSSDEDVDGLYDGLSIERKQQYLQWPTREKFRRSWEKDELIVEPGESETEIFEFIVSRDIESVLLTTYFYNSRVLGKIPKDSDTTEAPRLREKLKWWREVKGPRGWSRTTVYDIIEGE